MGCFLFLSAFAVLASAVANRAIVIGAGAAGLEAARNLEAKGYTVTVLEARARNGGRLYTVNDLGVPIDHGAAWIFSAGANIVSNPFYVEAVASGWPIKETRGPGITNPNFGSPLPNSTLQLADTVAAAVAAYLSKCIVFACLVLVLLWIWVCLWIRCWIGLLFGLLRFFFSKKMVAFPTLLSEPL